MINFAFFGTDEFSVDVLNSLKKEGFLPTLIITVPDKPKGRKMVMTPPLAKVWATENNITCKQPATLKPVFPDGSSNPIYAILNTNYDLFIVASYGKIIPQPILDLPQHGTLNVHPSLLPKYRGASPLESAILSGDTETGVSIMLLDADMDHGPILDIKKLVLTGEEYFEDLRHATAVIGGKMLSELMPLWIERKIEAKPQDHAKATFTKKIEKEDGLINFDFIRVVPSIEQSINFYRQIRALTPWPGAYFFVNKNGRQIRIAIRAAKLTDNKLVIERVTPEGKTEMAWEDFKRNFTK